MGRAPTSGNCHTCRMRRVKCDRGRPSCERCVKAGYECKGYETVLRIQSHSVVAGAKPGTARLAKIQTVSSFPTAGPDEVPLTTLKAKKQLMRTKQQQEQAQAQTQAMTVGSFSLPKRPHGPPGPGSDSTRSRSQGVNSGSDDDRSRRSASDSTRNSSPPPEVSLEGFVDDITFSYFFHSYGWINMHSILLQDASMRDSLTEGMAYDSLRALAYGLMGKDQHIQSLQAQGAKLYGNTLRKLRSKLSTQSKDELAALIKPIAIMGSYLISVENDLRFTHHRGLSRIMEHCGPEYFQSPALLPIYESCRLTMISNAIVRRTSTFLSQEKWKTVPWAWAPHTKTWTSKLLDLMTDIPNLIEAVLGLMVNRVQWWASGYSAASPEDPTEVPRLQARVLAISEGLADWRLQWEAAHPDTGPEIMSWTFNLASHDDYRPGVQGFIGPDVYNYSLLSPVSPPPFLQSDTSTYIQMQDVALYTTILIWTGRLTKYLAGAAVDNTNMDFYNHAFYSTCTCCKSKFADTCDTVPDSNADVMHSVAATDPAMSWNFNSARIAVAPIKVAEKANNRLLRDVTVETNNKNKKYRDYQCEKQPELEIPGVVYPTYKENAYILPLEGQTTSVMGGDEDISKPRDYQQQHLRQEQQNQQPPQLLPSPPASAGFPRTVEVLNPKPPMLLPGDVRFSSQLRILSWLTDRLPATRPQVLSTLAAVGLGHCGHDVRPLEGIREVAEVVSVTLDRTNFEGAERVILRRYR